MWSTQAPIKNCAPVTKMRLLTWVYGIASHISYIGWGGRKFKTSSHGSASKVISLQ